MCHTGGFLVWHFFSRRLAGLRLIDVRHANQRLIQLLDILRIDLDLYLITGDKGLSGGSQVLAIPVNSLDDTTLGEGEVIYLLPVEIGTVMISTNRLERPSVRKAGVEIISS